ncbi:MAG: hypothetical protein Q4A29_03075 [Eubacteriales bacterium]|nr:hypothetical protein [Eubacteriales bacterium]
MDLNKELSQSNLLSYRGKLSQAEITQKMMEIVKYLQNRQISFCGDVITVTYGLEADKYDIEILIPLKEQVELPEYHFKSRLLITNAVYQKVERAEELTNILENLDKKIREKGLNPITGYYVYQKNVGKSNMEIEIYVGINPNIM